MFSSRTSWQRRADEMAQAVQRRRAAGLPVLDLTESNPTRTGLAWDHDQLADALASGPIESYEPSARGLEAAREAVAGALAARGVGIRADRIVLTASTSEAYSFLFRLLCDPGDAVMIPQPGYPLFDVLADLDAVERVPYRLRLRDRWRIDVDALASVMPPRARAVLVVSPGNPTGAFVEQPEASRLARLCAERSVAIVGDEVFADFAWDAAPEPPSLLSLARESGALVFGLGGLSKSCGLPQLKLGWIAVDGPPAAVDEALARLELIADTYLSASTPVQLAAPALLSAGAAFRQRLLARVRGNLEALRAAGARVLPAEAGWSAIVELAPEAEEDAVVLRLLEEDGVLAQPGWHFDLPGRHVVISLIVPPEDFARGAGAIAAAAR